MFSQEERHHEISHNNSSTDSLAFLANTRKQYEKATYNNFQKHAGGVGNSGYHTCKSSVGPKKGSKYYCTHFKINGHSIERCFKVNGYHPGFKNNRDRKVAAVSCGTTNDVIHQDQNQSISVAQYNQLMALLSNQHISNPVTP